LLARGAFLVSASIENGRIGSVELHSQAGGTCRLRNPWPETTVTLSRDGQQAEVLIGSLLVFPTELGKTLVLGATERGQQSA
jgi:hypothetical protein